MHVLTVGLLADTHIPYRMKQLPAAALDALAGVDLILHAGDVDDPRALEPLQAIAPVYAVRGNFHLQDFSDGGASLPAMIELELAGRRVVLTHGHRRGVVGILLKVIDKAAMLAGLPQHERFNLRTARYLVRCYPTADIIVFGHTHMPYIERFGRTWLINPGAVCANVCTRPAQRERPSLARMELDTGKSRVEIIYLDE